MTKADRVKMEERIGRHFDDTLKADWRHLDEDIFSAVAREVTRAVRAERKAQRDTEELWASHRQRADEHMIERAMKLGRKRT